MGMGEAFKQLIETALVVLNREGFCLDLDHTMILPKFWKAYFRDYGLDYDTDVIQSMNTTTHFSKSYSRSDKPRIPLITHRVWTTYPDNPRDPIDEWIENGWTEGFHKAYALLTKDLPEGVTWTH